jgi:Ni,Fe-hydrogenase III large subunit
MADTAKVEGHAHLVRDLKSQAIINTDCDAYARYMARKRKQKASNDEIREVIRDVNKLKTEMSEIKDLLIGLSNGR